MTDPEFSRPVAVERLGRDGSEFTIEADAAERAALAVRFRILAVDSLDAQLRLVPGAGGVVRLSGRVRAAVRQACVVTLDPVAARIDEPIERSYAPAAGGPAEVVVALDEEDPPDPLVGDIVDIGEAAAEALALALDPYPRAPGAVFHAPSDRAPETPATASPFASLEAWKRR